MLHRFLFQTRVCILYIYIIIIIIHSSLNVYHFANLYVYIFSTTLSYIIECTDPFCCYIKQKQKKKYYCYWISYNNEINESYVFVYINCVKLRDQTKYSLLCILRECIISTKKRVSSSMTFYDLFDAWAIFRNRNSAYQIEMTFYFVFCCDWWRLAHKFLLKEEKKDKNL